MQQSKGVCCRHTTAGENEQDDYGSGAPNIKGKIIDYYNDSLDGYQYTNKPSCQKTLSGGQYHSSSDTPTMQDKEDKSQPIISDPSQYYEYCDDNENEYYV